MLESKDVSSRPPSLSKFTHETTPIVPREFITKPFFPAKAQIAPRVVEYDGVKWTIGAERFDRRAKSPPFDMRHGRVCFALLTFRDRLQNNREVGFSINELAHRVAKSNGGRYSRDLINILFDLRDTWVRREFPNGDTHDFSILGQIEIFNKPARRRDALKAVDQQRELWLDFVTLTPQFFGLLSDYQQLARFRFDVMTSMTSDVAQSIYTFLPSRAFHHTCEKPFEIRLATLMDQIGLSVPKHKSTRYQKFTQHKTPIISQLDGAPTVSGTLRVRLAETKDGTDYKMLAWVKPAGPTYTLPPKPSGGLLKAWLDTGRGKRQFDFRMRQRSPISQYACDMMDRADIEYHGNEVFFSMAAALIGENRFHMEVSEIKDEVLRDSFSIGSYTPTARLIWRLMEVVKTAPR